MSRPLEINATRARLRGVESGNSFARMSVLPFSLPPELERELRGRGAAPVSIGMSKADVFRLEGGLYLKALRRNALDPWLGNLEGERLRLEWLGRWLPVPTVLAFARDEQRDYLLMSEVSGQHAAAEIPTANDMPRMIQALASACRAFHALPKADCPFDENVDHLIVQSEARLVAGLVETEDFDAERQGRDPRDLYQELLASRPAHDDRVVAHGDLCLPNVILRGEQAAGFVDVGRAGISDRWRDLALCARSISDNWGLEWSEAFLDAYGVARDERKRAFYVLLDEFF